MPAQVGPSSASNNEYGGGGASSFPSFREADGSSYDWLAGFLGVAESESSSYFGRQDQ